MAAAAGSLPGGTDRTAVVGRLKSQRNTASFVIVALLLSMAVDSSGARSPKDLYSSYYRLKPRFPPSLEFYVHALITSSATYTTSPSKPSLTGTFGHTAIFDYNITSGLDAASSRQLGSIRGFEAYNALDPAFATILVLNTITYDDGTYNGTFCLHGQANINLTSYDIPVVGGTGSFVGASGYSHVTNLRTPGDDHVFEHIVHFFV